MNGAAYLEDAKKRFREVRELADGALAQVPYELWHRRLDPESNSLVTIMLHLSGNMISRWTDFLASDGEKPDRDRDAEFEDLPGIEREELLARWERGLAVLFGALEGLNDADLPAVVHIRTRELTVTEAIQRQLAHYSYHVGQMVFLAKHLASGRWRSLSIPRGGSQAFDTKLKSRP